MRVRFVGYASMFSAAVILASAIACSSETAPDVRTQMRIYGIQVPQHAAVGDTIRISFFLASTSKCGFSRDLIIEESGGGSNALRFSATSVPIDECFPAAQVLPVPRIFLVPPFYSIPFTVQFAEPNEADSVRVIPAQ